MNNVGTGRLSLGESLLKAGWYQGSLFSAPSLRYAWNGPPEAHGTDPSAIRSRKAKASERLVLVSQECDIAADVQAEPFVEALICTVEKRKEFLAGIDRNSARWFAISLEKGLVAQARYRVQIAKELLKEYTPEPWPSDPDRLSRFIRWLARRYDRPAFPDSMVDAFERPLAAALDELFSNQPAVASAFNRAIREIRVNMPLAEAPPFDLQLVLLARTERLTEAEADAIEVVTREIQSSLDPAPVRLNPEIRVLTEEEMTMAEYFATRPLFLEYHTYRGNEVEGAEPTPRG